MLKFKSFVSTYVADSECEHLRCSQADNGK